ncbi:MAG: hypothetical protein ACRDVW_09655 [Acidimicrobiales bacterium]
MTTNDSWRRYLETGAAVGQATMARAEEIAKGLFDPDENERESAWRDLEELTRFGRMMGEQLAETAKAEVARQLNHAGGAPLERLFERISHLLGVPSPAPTDTVSDAPSGKPVIGATVTVTTIPAVKAPDRDEPTRSKKAKKKAKHHKTGPKSERKGKKKDKSHKKDAKHKSHGEKEKASSKHPAAEPRVLTLARPLDPAHRF